MYIKIGQFHLFWHHLITFNFARLWQRSVSLIWEFVLTYLIWWAGRALILAELWGLKACSIDVINDYWRFNFSGQMKRRRSQKRKKKDWKGKIFIILPWWKHFELWELTMALKNNLNCDWMHCCQRGTYFRDLVPIETFFRNGVPICYSGSLFSVFRENQFENKGPFFGPYFMKSRVSNFKPGVS